MQTQRINITLPMEVIKNLRRSIPSGKRSNFIAKTLTEKLAKKRDINKELVRSLKANRKLYEEVAKDWGPIETEGWPEWDGPITK